MFTSETKAIFFFLPVLTRTQAKAKAKWWIRQRTNQYGFIWTRTKYVCVCIYTHSHTNRISFYAPLHIPTLTYDKIFTQSDTDFCDCAQHGDRISQKFILEISIKNTRTYTESFYMCMQLHGQFSTAHKYQSALKYLHNP